MNKSVANIQKQITPILIQAGIKKSSIFGSVAREEHVDTSDIDLLIDPPEGFSLLDLVRLENELAAKLHKDVDLVTFRSISKKIKDNILNDEVRIL